MYFEHVAPDLSERLTEKQKRMAKLEKLTVGLQYLLFLLIAGSFAAGAYWTHLSEKRGEDRLTERLETIKRICVGNGRVVLVIEEGRPTQALCEQKIEIVVPDESNKVKP